MSLGTMLVLALVCASQDANVDAAGSAGAFAGEGTLTKETDKLKMTVLLSLDYEPTSKQFSVKGKFIELGTDKDSYNVVVRTVIATYAFFRIAQSGWQKIEQPGAQTTNIEKTVTKDTVVSKTKPLSFATDPFNLPQSVDAATSYVRVRIKFTVADAKPREIKADVVMPLQQIVAPRAFANPEGNEDTALLADTTDALEVTCKPTFVVDPTDPNAIGVKLELNSKKGTPAVNFKDITGALVFEKATPTPNLYEILPAYTEPSFLAADPPTVTDAAIDGGGPESQVSPVAGPKDVKNKPEATHVVTEFTFNAKDAAQVAVAADLIVNEVPIAKISQKAKKKKP